MITSTRKKMRTRFAIGVFVAALGSVVFAYTTIHALYYYVPEHEASVSSQFIRAISATTSRGTSSASSSTLTATSEKIPDKIPTRIVIPSVGVDTQIDPVGISYKGNMMVPDNFTDTGWYKYGTTPGDVGSAVIDGHVNDGVGFPAVFANLKNVPVGADVFVYMKNTSGTNENETSAQSHNSTDNEVPLHFVVTDVETYYYTDAPLQKIFNQNDTARLNLITCDGEWLSSAQTDDHRVVVYTRLVTN